jgi:hypothetical protein
MGYNFLDINIGYPRPNQNHSLILIINMAFLDMGVNSLNTCHFQHTIMLGQSFIV